MIDEKKGSTIRILDQATVNQIAAGEVVERPASVVKELVENAVDAGAHAILIDITTSTEGIRSIQVIDDGSGMSPADAVLAFAPHATSKILRIEDLPRARYARIPGRSTCQHRRSFESYPDNTAPGTRDYRGDKGCC